MSKLIRAYDALVHGAAAIGSLLIAAIFLAIVADVALRSLGFRPPAGTSALSEYAMLYMTMLMAPALVRSGGHVAVESFVGQLPAGARGGLRKASFVACIAVSLLLAWYAGAMALDAALRGEIDVRSIEIPRWVLVGILPIGFLLCAAEFSRLLFRRGDGEG